MTRNLKALGAIAAAALAMSAVFATAAQAEKQFKGGETGGNPEHTTTTLHGAQEGTEEDNFFQIEGVTKTTCTNNGVTFDGTIAGGTASTLTVTPTYTECWQVGTTRNVTVTMNGCDYTFTTPTEIAPNEFTGKADLHCPIGSAIEVHVYAADGQVAHTGAHGFALCTITITPVNANTEDVTEQELGGHVIYNNKPNVEVTPGILRDDVTVNATITGIYWEKHGLCGNAEGHDGVYRNTVTVTGPAGGGASHHDVWIG